MPRFPGLPWVVATFAIAAPAHAASQIDLPVDALTAPALHEMSAANRRMPAIMARLRADVASVEHVRDIEWGPARRANLDALYRSWQARLREIDGSAMGVEDRIDLLLLTRQLEWRRDELAFAAQRYDAVRDLLPGVDALLALLERWRAKLPQEGEVSAQLLSKSANVLSDFQRRVERSKPDISPIHALRAARIVESVRNDLKAWHAYYDGYDPVFGWWVQTPWKSLDTLLEKHAATLKRIAGTDDTEHIVGDPVGRAALLRALAHEMVPYTPEELMQLAEHELAFGEAELRKVAAEMGYANWHEALEKVKADHVAPGAQTALVRQLADEAVAFLDSRDLITIPALARVDWRMNMLSAQAQLQAPFFLGGEDVWVAAPLAEMENARKLMTLRGNNRAFSRAVVHHELIPGHHLQHYYAARYNTERQWFQTPFWTEGWSLYWELRLWDLGFARSPEEKIGMLFWRNHRAARILFSLGFHLGKVTPEQAIEMLVQRVGHERDNAAAEVRRSFAGDYPPLYQAGYLIGGLQLQALHRELVRDGGMREREFHDRILRGGPMPIEMVRSRLLGRGPDLDYKASWRFYPLPQK